MMLTFAETHNMIAYLSKSDVSEGCNQIIDVLTGSLIKYALTVNPNIYVSCIKQVWTFVAMKKVNDVMRLQALVNKKKVVISEAIIRDALHLDDAEGIECLPNEEIFAELARMGYEKPSTKLTFYKAFFSSQWNSSMASAVICLSTGKGFSRVGTPLFEGMIVEQPIDEGDAEVNVENVSTVGIVVEGDVSAANDAVPIAVEEPSIPSPTPPTPPPQPSQDQPSTSKGRQAESQAQIYKFDLEHANKVLSMQDDEGEPSELQEVVEVVTTAKLITEVVTAASATITTAAPQLTTTAARTLTTAPSAARRRKGVLIRDPKEFATPSTIIYTEAKSRDKGKGILVEEPKPLKKQVQVEQDEAYARELEAELNKNIDWDKTEAQARKNMMIYLRNVVGFKIYYFKGMTYDDIRPIFKKHFNSNVAFLLKTKEQMDEEDSRALKRLS
uniref:Xylulose kinase-1 n=1 Tax=Tanacetum cinerariifolium TaxID=118510 RepID=A0A6L2LIS7_TANCI|nr:hypothetical protein [Tanacetum cinerariifolium]